MAPGSIPVPFGSTNVNSMRAANALFCSAVFVQPGTRCLAGLRRILRRADYNLAPCGWERGAKWAWLVLADRKAIERLLARFGDFERPGPAPRRPAGTHICSVVYRWPPACTAAENAGKRPRPEEKSFVLRKKKQIHTCT